MSKTRWHGGELQPIAPRNRPRYPWGGTDRFPSLSPEGEGRQALSLSNRRVLHYWRKGRTAPALWPRLGRVFTERDLTLGARAPCSSERGQCMQEPPHRGGRDTSWGGVEKTTGVTTILFIVIPIFIFIFSFIRCALGDKPGCFSGLVFNVSVKVNARACGHAGRANRSSAVECPLIPFRSGRTNGGWEIEAWHGEPLEPRWNSTSVQLGNGEHPATSLGRDGPSNRSLLPPGRRLRRSCWRSCS